jgi:hypothetical protein
MNSRSPRLLLFLVTALRLSSSGDAENLKSVDTFRDAASKGGPQLTVPNWEQMPSAVDESIEKFLGRKQSVQPFLRKIGIENKGAHPAASRSKIVDPVASAVLSGYSASRCVDVFELR